MAIKYDAILGTLREKDECGFNPAGIYPELTVGGIIARESDAVIDLRTSFIFRSAGGNESIATGAAKISSICGNVVDGVPFNATHFKSIGFNAFNPENVMDKAIASDGTISESNDHKVVYVHVIAGSAGSGHNNGYIISSKESAALIVNRVAFVASDPTGATSSTVLTATPIDASRSAYIPTTEGWLLIDCYNDQLADMCVHLAWSYNPQDWKAYKESIIALPTVHEWGMGKAGNVYDEVDFINQAVTLRVNRKLLSELTWAESRTAGDNAYSNDTLSTIAGEIIATAEGSITVGETTYARDAEHDTAAAYAWKNESVTVYTASATPSAPTYTYSTEGIKTDIKASTTNLYIYGLSSSYTFTVASDGTLTLSTGTAQETPGNYDIYLYYEMATEEIRPEELNPIYDVDDFGTEEFIGTTVAPTYATFFYMPNLYDSIREVIYQEKADHTCTVDFSEVREVFSSRNVVKDMKIRDIVCDNVTTLKIYKNGTLVQTLNSIVNGTATTVNMTIEKYDKFTFEITRITELQPAQVNYSYQY